MRGSLCRLDPDLEQDGNTSIAGLRRDPRQRRYGPRPRPPLVPSRVLPAVGVDILEYLGRGLGSRTLI